ncbi:hypothetical protein BO94DRAFT_379535 [Aspergillus sclerotioniger CBS 115572]|uniref:Uncharacterized protein n=1 Tax=Aspergillus sclerotioniger CBS 115572 TaxID=1450535 RepID=A0A317WZG8_9EURO|nr:hypothetical protein BO94DRAFT_379535 [Aspergillus sclerotioniger CBS 115572]PWY91776.1 hypothetical protein BO94DRAFT_379535 [Aspergillus sclerotioniger CBS 115572]
MLTMPRRPLSGQQKKDIHLAVKTTGRGPFSLADRESVLACGLRLMIWLTRSFSPYHAVYALRTVMMGYTSGSIRFGACSKVFFHEGGYYNARCIAMRTYHIHRWLTLEHTNRSAALSLQPAFQQRHAVDQSKTMPRASGYVGRACLVWAANSFIDPFRITTNNNTNLEDRIATIIAVC